MPHSLPLSIYFCCSQKSRKKAEKNSFRHSWCSWLCTIPLTGHHGINMASLSFARVCRGRWQSCFHLCQCQFSRAWCLNPSHVCPRLLGMSSFCCTQWTRCLQPGHKLRLYQASRPTRVCCLFPRSNEAHSSNDRQLGAHCLMECLLMVLCVGLKQEKMCTRHNKVMCCACIVQYFLLGFETN